MRPLRLRVEGSAGRAPTLHQFLGPGICLTTEENHGKTSVRAPEKCSAYQRRVRFVWSTWPSTSGGLDWSAGTAAVGLHFERRGQPSAEVDLFTLAACTVFTAVAAYSIPIPRIGASLR